MTEGQWFKPLLFKHHANAAALKCQIIPQLPFNNTNVTQANNGHKRATLNEPLRMLKR